MESAGKVLLIARIVILSGERPHEAAAAVGARVVFHAPHGVVVKRAPQHTEGEHDKEHPSRQITRHARLYSEMVTTGALLHGDVPRHLAFSPEEQPVALQLGGRSPA